MLDRSQLGNFIHEHINSSLEACFIHRLHCVYLVALGHPCTLVASWFGIHARTLERWVDRACKEGVDSLQPLSSPGRPARLDIEMFNQVRFLLSSPPSDFGYEGIRWTGRSLSTFLRENVGVELSERQCQRLLRRIYAA